MVGALPALLGEPASAPGRGSELGLLMSTRLVATTIGLVIKVRSWSHLSLVAFLCL